MEERRRWGSCLLVVEQVQMEVGCGLLVLTADTTTPNNTKNKRGRGPTIRRTEKNRWRAIVIVPSMYGD